MKIDDLDNEKYNDYERVLLFKDQLIDLKIIM